MKNIGNLPASSLYSNLHPLKVHLNEKQNTGTLYTLTLHEFPLLKNSIYYISSLYISNLE